MAPGHARHGGRNDGSWLDDQRTAQLSRARHVFGYLGCTQTSVLTTRCDTSRQLRDTTVFLTWLSPCGTARLAPSTGIPVATASPRHALGLALRRVLHLAVPVQGPSRPASTASAVAVPRSGTVLDMARERKTAWRGRRMQRTLGMGIVVGMLSAHTSIYHEHREAHVLRSGAVLLPAEPYPGARRSKTCRL